MFISVLICTRNRADSLRQTLDSLFCRNNPQLPEWEAVVVDNDSDDHTAQVCRDFRERFPGHFRFLVEKKPGKSNALNTAIAAARGDILAFTDDDVLCAPGYLQGIRTVFDRYPADGVQGRILLDCEGGHPEWLDSYLGVILGWRDCGGEVIDVSENRGFLGGIGPRWRWPSGRYRVQRPNAPSRLSADLRASDPGSAPLAAEAPN